jgi:hypothetical protein
MFIQIPVSPAELIDKITILEIKIEEFDDEIKRKNVSTELELLRTILESQLISGDTLSKLYTELRIVNKKIWDTENDVRKFWDDEMRFQHAARESHYNNDERARIKKEINKLLGSLIIEEKSHPKYEHR